MYKLEKIAERIRQTFDVRTSKRDEALKQARQLTRACSLAIRAVHRDDKETMEAYLAEAQTSQMYSVMNLRGIPSSFSRDTLRIRSRNLWKPR